MVERDNSRQGDGGARLYFESQRSALCGLHAINTLLQGPYFTEIELSEIAQKLDRMERSLLGENASSEQKNMDATGMFSTQVLEKALEPWNLQLIPITSPAAGTAANNPSMEQAFLCNLEEHWFTLRKCGDDWWNFNSLLAAPEPLSAFYLAAFLSSLQREGYTVFVVRGSFPSPAESLSQFEAATFWISPEDAREKSKKHSQLSKRTHHGAVMTAAASGRSSWNSIGAMIRPAEDLRQMIAFRLSQMRDIGAYGVDEIRLVDESMEYEEDLQRALAASRAEIDLHGNQAMEQIAETDTDDMARAIFASLQDQRVHDREVEATDDIVQVQSMESFDDTSRLPLPSTSPLLQEDPSMEADMSTNNAGVVHDVRSHQNVVIPILEDEPSILDNSHGHPDSIIGLALCLPWGERVFRRFLSSSPVSQIIAWGASHGVDMQQYRIATSFPRRIFTDLSLSLRESGIEDKLLLRLEAL